MSLEGRVVGGKYRTKRLLGSGGMGMVFEGEHLEIGRRVAIKILEPERAQSAEIVSRFRREARATSAIESEHIVQVFDAGQDPDVGLFIVMEFLEGEDLATRLTRVKRLDPVEASRIAIQVARALAKAHQAGIVHRDLKPANVYLCSREHGDDLIKVLDFGISKILRGEAHGPVSATTGAPITRVGTAIGTPQYMSPEQAQGLAVDARSDVWSLGALLYEMIAGAPAYDALGTYEQTIIRIVTTPAEPLLSVAPWTPEPLSRLVHAMLVHPIDRRIPSCERVVQYLLQACPECDPVAARRLQSNSGASTELLPPLSSAHHRVADPLGSSPTVVASGPSTVQGVTVSTGARRVIAEDPPPPRSSLEWDEPAAGVPKKRPLLVAGLLALGMLSLGVGAVVVAANFLQSGPPLAAVDANVAQGSAGRATASSATLVGASSMPSVPSSAPSASAAPSASIAAAKPPPPTRYTGTAAGATARATGGVVAPPTTTNTTPGHVSTASSL